MKKRTINDSDREQAVENTESLYLAAKEWQKKNKGGMRGFIRSHREEIDRIIRKWFSG